jgi:hypothetical protein
MQKLSGTSSGKNNKSCRICHNEANNIGIAFFLNFLQFSTQFTRFSQSHILLKLHIFTKTPETFWYFTDMPPVHTKLLRQKLGHAIGSSAMASGGLAKSDQAGGVLGREKGGEGAGAHLRLDCDRGWGCGGTGEVTRRSWTAAAAGVATPATGWRGPNNTRHREVLRTLGTRLGRLGGDGTSCNQWRGGGRRGRRSM